MSLFPFLLVTIITHLGLDRIAQYRRVARRSTGIVVGYIGEMFGAIQVIKAAHAETAVLDRFDRLNRRRKDAAIKDTVFNQVLHSMFINSANVGMGVVLLLASGSMQHGSSSVGDFARLVFHPGLISELTSFVDIPIARYKQIGVSVGRMEQLMEGTADTALIEPVNVFVHHDYPPIPEPHLTRPMESLEVRELSDRYEGTDSGTSDISFTVPRARSRSSLDASEPDR